MTGAPCTADPSAMRPPDGLNQTVIGQLPWPKNRTAEEEKRQRQHVALVSARRLLAEARGMVKAVVAVSVKAVEAADHP